MADPYKSHSKRKPGLKDDLEAEERREKKIPPKFCLLTNDLALFTEKTVYNITKPSSGKGHRFLMGTRMCDAAFDAMTACYEANEIYPLSVKDYIERRRLLQQALGNLSTLDALIDIAKANIEFSSAILKDWIHKLNEARKYVKGIYNSDTEAMKKMIASRGKNNYVNATDLIETISGLIQ